MSITVEMLGKAQVKKNTNFVTFPYRKAEGLFYYLIARQTITRDEAIGIFWTDCSEETGRKNLRDALYHKKKHLGKNIIQIHGKNSISINLSLVDHVDFLELTDAQLLQEPFGPFLDYFYIKDCPLFEEWVDAMRNKLQDRFLTVARKYLEVTSKDINSSTLFTIGTLVIDYKLYDDELIKKILECLLESGYYMEAKKIHTLYAKMLECEYDDEISSELTSLITENNTLKINRHSNTNKFQVPTFFFYRDKEITVINDNFRRFLTGCPYTSLLITGEAGVGKSALLNRVSSGIGPDSAVVLRYQCIQTELELYLRPWNDFLAQIEILIRQNTANSVPAITEFSAQANIFATQYEQYVKNAFCMLYQHLEEKKKIVLIIDDVQWMDYASMRLLANILSWDKESRILAILASRTELPAESLKIKNSLLSRDLLTEISLSRFTYEETEEIISAYHPNLGKQKEIVDKIFNNTAGNALFLLELLKDYNPANSVQELTKKTVIMIQNRLLELSIEEQYILDTISLFPQFATLKDLQLFDQRPLESILMDIEHLFTCQLICFNNTYFNNGYAFSHQLIREYVYGHLLPDKKIVMHSIVADSYEKDYQQTHSSRLFSTLIHHFKGANNLYKAYNYQLEYFCNIYTIQNEIYPLTLSTEKFSASHPLPLTSADALVALAKKVRTLDPSIPNADLLKMKLEFLIGRYDLYSGAFEHGLKNIQNSIAIAKKRNDHNYLLKNYLQMIFHGIQVNNLKMFNDYLTLSESLIETGTFSKATIYTIKRLRGLFFMKNYRYDEAERIFLEIIKILSDSPTQDDSTNIALAACSNYIGECRQMTGKTDEALDYFFKAIEYSKDEPNFSGLAIFYCNIGQLYYHLEEYKKAATYIDAALDCMEKTDALWGKARVNCYKALLEINNKNWKNARYYYKKASDFAEIGRNPITLSLLNQVQAKFNFPAN